MSASEYERNLRWTIAAHEYLANTTGRSARTAPSRQALNANLLEEACGDPQRDERLRKAHFTRIPLESFQARRKAREAVATAESAEAELIISDYASVEPVTAVDWTKVEPADDGGAA